MLKLQRLERKGPIKRLILHIFITRSTLRSSGVGINSGGRVRRVCSKLCECEIGAGVVPERL
jgi:hypothetical protein